MGVPSPSMRPPRIGILALSILLVPMLVGTGCRRDAPVRYETWATPAPSYTPVRESGNAFDAYALAAVRVENEGSKHLDRVSFYPDQRAQARIVGRPAMLDVIRASGRSHEFKFVPHLPFQAAPYQRGWRFIGRCLRWEIEEAVLTEDYDTAVDTLLAGTRFGFDLTGGGATDAALGLGIVDELRIAILPALPKMGSAQLGRLSEGLRAALARKGPISEAIEHERLNSRLGLQALQDGFLREDLREFHDKLGADMREPIEYVQKLKSKSEDKRLAYFQGLASEGDEEIHALIRQSAMPASERSKDPGAKKIKDRPWKRIVPHLFLAARPLLEMDDRTLARTKLLALECDLLKRRKMGQAMPTNLDGYGKEATTDPYTGKPFLYRWDKVQFSLYSQGSNGRDDGGDTDESFSMPDLTLERKL